MTAGEMVAYDWDDLTDGALLSPIVFNENGAGKSDGIIMTATREDGNYFNLGPVDLACFAYGDATFDDGWQDCADWTNNSSLYGGIVGFANKTDRNWSAAREYWYAPEYPSCPYCNWLSSYGGSSLYCFQQ